MSRNTLMLVAAAALLGSASTAIAQGPPAGGPGRMRSAVAIVLENKDTLALTAEQVTKLEEIRKAAAAKNEPIMEKMRAARESGAGMEGAREIMAEARKNDQEAFDAALALLTDVQKTKAQEIVTKVREEMRGRRPGSS